MSELSKRLAVIRERIALHAGKGINETASKTILISPMLKALGWDYEDLEQVYMEYPLQAANTRVDYALMHQDTPRLFVEAKALGTDLDDLKWASQILGYASVAGVEWVVLTDGNEYRIHNAHASVPVEEKLFHTIRAADDDAHAAEILELLARDGLRDNRLEGNWRARFADRQVKAALEGLFGPAPDKSFVNLLQEGTENLTAGDVAASLRRVQARFDFPVVSRDAPEAPAVPEIADAPDGPPKPQKPKIVTLKRLVNAGIVQPPLDLHAQHKSKQFYARIEANGTVTVHGQKFRALWRATEAALVAGGLPRKAPDNMWSFWRFTDADGQDKPLKYLRDQYFTRSESKAVPETVNAPDGTSQRPHGGDGLKTVQLKHVIQSGIVRLPLDLHARYKSQHVSARIEADGTVTFRGQRYTTASRAGTAAKRFVRGTPRKQLQTDGWYFWRYKDADGQVKLLKVLRDRFRAGEGSQES